MAKHRYKQLELSLEGNRTVEPSCAHPYEGEPVAVSETPRPIFCLPIAGYAAQHAPDTVKGYSIGRMSAFVRQFDRDRGKILSRP